MTPGYYPNGNFVDPCRMPDMQQETISSQDQVRSTSDQNDVTTSAIRIKDRLRLCL